jgi:hypothetical protein
MEAIITISETPDFKYSCVLLPRDAESIRLVRSTYTDHCTIIHKYGFIELGEIPEIELMGILGEDLTEDQAREIIEAIPDYGIRYYSDTFLEDMYDLVKDKGVSNELKKVIIKTKK